MNIAKVSLALVLAFLVILTMATACSPKDKDEARDAVQQIEDKTKDIAEDAAQKTKEVVADAAAKGKEIVSSTGEAITDGWITTKVKAKFADDKLLKESNITVDTNDRVITLKGPVTSAEAKKRAAMIAEGTEGVLRVADQVVVKAK
jgi:hyperosmotically inducible protein